MTLAGIIMDKEEEPDEQVIELLPFHANFTIKKEIY
jgi:hypothetical protein